MLQHVAGCCREDRTCYNIYFDDCSIPDEVSSVLQRVGVCCSELECVGACWSVLQRVVVCCSEDCNHYDIYVDDCYGPDDVCSMLQCVAVCCSVLQRAAVCCSVLHCVALRSSVLQCAAWCLVI